MIDARPPLRARLRRASSAAAATGCAVAVALALGAARAPLQDPVSFQVEGELRNDSFQPVAEAAAVQIEQGDRAWRQALNAGAGGGGARQARIRAYDAWQRALRVSEVGDAVRLREPHEARLWPDPDRTHERRTEGVAYAVLRRLMSVEDEHRAEWRERFEDTARAALAARPFAPRALARVERDHPLCDTAAVAALRLADQAFEEGRAADAALWLERCERHVGAPTTDMPTTDMNAPWPRAIERRRRAVREARPAPAPEAWQEATELFFERATRLESRRRAPTRVPAPPLGRGLETGMALLDDGSIALQTGLALVWLSPAAVSSATSGAIVRLPLAPLLGLERLSPFSAPSTGGWPNLPASDGRDLVLVVDRGRPGQKLRGDVSLRAQGNHLVLLRLDQRGDAEVRWAHSNAGPARDSAAGVLGPGTWQFQPGPLCLDGTVFVQARILPEPAGVGPTHGGEIWLFALDQATGGLRWKRLLSKGADLKDDLGGRLGPSDNLPTTGMPLAHAAGRVLVGTNVGVVVALDGADGRLAWSVRYRRRRASDRGWPGSRPPRAGEDGGSATFAPFDSDFLYTLRIAPDLAPGEGLMLQPPLPIGDAEDWVDRRAGAVLTLGRDGRHRALRVREPGRPLRSSLYLGSGERFTGPPLTSAGRILLATDQSLMLFDRRREELLLATEPIPDLGAGRGGALRGRGDRIFLLGTDTLWIWRVR